MVRHGAPWLHGKAVVSLLSLLLPGRSYCANPFCILAMQLLQRARHTYMNTAFQMQDVMLGKKLHGGGKILSFSN